MGGIVIRRAGDIILTANAGIAHCPGLHINGAAIAGFKAYYGFAIRFIDCNFDSNTIAIHSACTDVRIAGGNFYSNGNTAVLIDGGETIVVDNNVIEGTNGPAIIVSGGVWGWAPDLGRGTY